MDKLGILVTTWGYPHTGKPKQEQTKAGCWVLNGKRLLIPVWKIPFGLDSLGMFSAIFWLMLQLLTTIKYTPHFIKHHI